jgi:hypothetical protein
LQCDPAVIDEPKITPNSEAIVTTNTTETEIEPKVTTNTIETEIPQEVKGAHSSSFPSFSSFFSFQFFHFFPPFFDLDLSFVRVIFLRV